MFQGIEVKGWDAWGWVKANSGIGVIDHGFRIPPYGLEDDDWLFLDTDEARNRRQWRSKLLEEYYPIVSSSEGSKEKANPMLYLPKSHQLVGAVFVESHQTADTSGRPSDLIPAINREGFIDNEAYHDLHEMVRTGMELLALVDHRENRRIEEEKAKQAAQELRDDFGSAIDYIKSIPSLTEEDRDRLTVHYSELSKELENVETYFHEANQRMDMLALLGIVAGFMTHEAKRLVSDLDRLVNHLEHIAQKDDFTKRVLPEIKNTLGEFKGQIEYSTIFIDSIQDQTIKPGPIPVAPQIEFVKERFDKFVRERDIDVIIDVDRDLLGPAVPAVMYSGILMNLYTNALKAVSSGVGKGGQRRIAFKAWNEPKWHVVEVADTGIGIPPNLRKRIWDPLFTTTSGGSSNPLGSGMGLGLNLVKEIVSKVRGRIELADPPPGYSTCFKVQFPKA
jgi:signal transduction histidine kinase